MENDNTTHVDLPELPHYASASNNNWSSELFGTESVDGSDTSYAGILGIPITNFTLEGKGIKKFRVRNRKNKWLPYKTNFDKTIGAGDNTPITGIEIVGSGFIFSIHVKGGSWLPAVCTTNKEGEILAIAGSQIDAVWIDKIS